jgi:hypothetical protein
MANGTLARTHLKMLKAAAIAGIVFFVDRNNLAA